MAEYSVNLSKIDLKSLGSVEQPDVPYDNYKTGVMSTRDILANILRNIKDPNIAGITHRFSEDKLILSVHAYEFPSDQVLKDMISTMNEVIKWLKKKYKEDTGVTLKLKQVSDAYDVVTAYTTNKKAKITYHLTFDISKNKLDSKMNSLDDVGGYTDRDNDKIEFKLA